MKRLVLALCLLALPSAAMADGDYRYELTPHLSYHMGGTFHAESNSPFSSDLEVDNGIAYGLNFDIPLSSNLQLEILLNRQNSDLFFDAGIFGPDIEFLEADLTYAHLGLLVQFGRPAVTPFIVFSAGVTSINPDYPGAGSDDKFSLSIGGGVKAFFTEHVGMRLEGRAFWTTIDNFGVGCSGDTCYDYRDYLTQTEANVGLIFAW